jgi:S1-C subfamily serine protease
MRRATCYIFVVIALLIFALYPRAAAVNIPFDPSSSTVRIATNFGDTWKWSGSGVLVKDGVLTAWHVVNGSRRVAIWLADNRTFEMSTWRRVGDKDLGLIQYVGKIPNITELELADDDLVSDVETVCVGYWGASFKTGLPVKTIGMTYPRLGSKREYLSSNLIEFGISGGPLLLGNIVVGVASAKPATPNSDSFMFFTRVSKKDF